jgi:site-specific DNA-methyltransferase (adenine-specific)
MVSSKTNEWATPQWFFDELNKEFNFTLDPCSNDNHKCDKFFTIKEDGLKQDWSKDIVFMNPPYGGHTGDWIAKALEESKKGAIVVCLIVSSTDRSYWHEYIFPFASQVRFIRGRLTFGKANSTAPFASAIVIFSKKKYTQQIIYYKESVSVIRNRLQKSKGQEKLLPLDTKQDGGTAFLPTLKGLGIQPTIL